MLQKFNGGTYVVQAGIVAFNRDDILNKEWNQMREDLVSLVISIVNDGLDEAEKDVYNSLTNLTSEQIGEKQ